ncbi:hypothetical protein D6777_02630 [Candidatus Woesearchaeota archaeon]|nr:MAG: hypothetical protein D6777_02630 [Candidatus Woesearchaeota archaeon]
MYNCQDSDNGLNLKERGFFLKGRSVVKDECDVENGGFVHETICTPGCNCQRVWEPCMFGTVCQNGKCVASTTNDKTDTVYENEYDLNIFKKGSVMGYEDYCLDSSTVVEYTSAQIGKEVKCPEGTYCYNGACVGANVKCHALTSTNVGNSRRYNIVVVGQDYHKVYSSHSQAVEEFRKDALHALGLDGLSYGVFSIEPYKSNIDKFNFWYVDRFVDADAQSPNTNSLSQEEITRRNKAKLSQRGLASVCQFSHKIIISLDALNGWNDNGGNLINIATSRLTDTSNCVSELSSCYQSLTQGDLAVFDINNNNCIDHTELQYFNKFDLCQEKAFFFGICENDNEERLNYICSSQRTGPTLAHEISHFFGLGDISFPSSNVIDNENLNPQIGTYPNCYASSSQTDCESNAPWRWLLGNGCGQPGVIDCTPYDLDYNKEIVCQPGCIRNYNSYRSIRYSIMPYGTALQGIPNRPTYVLGEWNEYYIDKKIKALLDIGRWPIFSIKR